MTEPIATGAWTDEEREKESYGEWDAREKAAIQALWGETWATRDAAAARVAVRRAARREAARIPPERDQAG